MPAVVAAAAAAAASGGALLIYLLLTCRPQPAPDAEREEEQAPLLSGSGAAQGSGSGDEREEPWPDRAPVTCCEAATVAARTARRTWELTVGRWGLHGIAFGIKRHMKRQVRDAALCFSIVAHSGTASVRVLFSIAHALLY